ncbi:MULTISPECIES: cyclopropane-fatty-acyl-phospholipid synthase family protein [Streptomyces]|uniref:SAM-dependent methyltransferase n=1 Tax=Streptomyces TaxID=1883 RepID=UPI000CD5747A|nr:MULTISPECIES: cyclopropane-fatty-acyl-phospholipid synthase family protein [Streptomyces]
MTAVADRLARLSENLIDSPLPVRLRAWDGSEAGPETGPIVEIRNRRALRRLLYRPGELGLARAWVAGELTVPGDLYAALEQVAGHLWEDPPPPPSRLARLAAARELLALAGAAPPPPPPAEETRRRGGRRHALHRDRQAVRHHYDVGNDFYALVLGPSMVYSCAYWGASAGESDPAATTLEEAQDAKLELICRKLGLRPGMRLLDVGCGWGSLVLHAARHHGATAVGVTLSEEQARLGVARVAAAGLADQVEIRVQDYREVEDGPYDAISSVGMAEHVGDATYLAYAERLHTLLAPGGRLLNHQIARRPAPRREDEYRLNPFIDSYVFPDGELAPVGRTVTQLERAGFEVRDVESLREHYALTLRQWVRNLEENWEEAVVAAGPGRARVWRLYMAASALAFERARIGVNQIVAVRPEPGGRSGLPLRARRWTAEPRDR